MQRINSNRSALTYCSGQYLNHATNLAFFLHYWSSPALCSADPSGDGIIMFDPPSFTCLIYNLLVQTLAGSHLNSSGHIPQFDCAMEGPRCSSVHLRSHLFCEAMATCRTGRGKRLFTTPSPFPSESRELLSA